MAGSKSSPHKITADRFSILVKINKAALVQTRDADRVQAVRRMSEVEGGSDWGGADYPEIDCPDEVVDATMRSITAVR